MLKLRTSTPTRLRPRRHDVGAALMLRFRQNGVAVSGSHSKLRLRTVDALHALMLTMICFAAAILMNDDWRGPSRSRLNPDVQYAIAPVEPPILARRMAPDSPEVPQTVSSTVVRLSSIEDDVDSALVVRPAPPVEKLRVAEEKPVHDQQPSSTSQAARQPLRAAMHLGEEAMRAVRR